MELIALLRSKIVQLIAVASLALMFFLKVREDIREDAVEDFTYELEKRDEENAQSIRDRVDAVPDRVQPDPDDQRGYRD